MGDTNASRARRGRVRRRTLGRPGCSRDTPSSGALGPDGAIWFVERNADKIGRITTRGTLTEYPINGGPVGITVGKDRQFFVDLFTAGAVARVNLAGQVTGQWALPGSVGPLQITSGFGLDIWVTDTSGGKIYRLTPYAQCR
jgi:virginiamycin B lyase